MKKLFSYNFLNKTGGRFANFASMLSYAFYPAFIAVLGLVDKNGSLADKVVISFSIVAAKEIFTFFLFLIFRTPWGLYKVLKTHMFNKYGLLAIVAGVLGGPIGFSMLTIGALLIGASSPDAITLSLAIVVTLVLEWHFLKIAKNKIVLFGILIVVLSAIGLLILQSDLTGWDSGIGIGFLFSFLAALAWGGEAFISQIVMQKNKTGMKSEDFLAIKLSTSSIVTFILMFVVSWTVSQTNKGFDVFSGFFTNTTLLWKIIVVGLSMLLARYFFFTGIRKTSSTETSAIVTLQIIVIPILVAIFSAGNLGAHSDDVALIKSAWFWVISAILTLGSLVISMPKQVSKIIKKLTGSK